MVLKLMHVHCFLQNTRIIKTYTGDGHSSSTSLHHAAHRAWIFTSTNLIDPMFYFSLSAKFIHCPERPKPKSHVNSLGKFCSPNTPWQNFVTQDRTRSTSLYTFNASNTPADAISLWAWHFSFFLR